MLKNNYSITYIIKMNAEHIIKLLVQFPWTKLTVFFPQLQIKGEVVSIHVTKAYRVCVGTAPLILHLRPGRRWGVKWIFWPFYYSMDMTLGGTKSWSGCFEEVQNPCPYCNFNLDLPGHSFVPITMS